MKKSWADRDTNKQIEVITNSDLYCMSSNLLEFGAETPTGRFTDSMLNKIKFGRKYKT